MFAARPNARLHAARVRAGAAVQQGGVDIVLMDRAALHPHHRAQTTGRATSHVRERLRVL